jgi:hypothetical protein
MSSKENPGLGMSDGQLLDKIATAQLHLCEKLVGLDLPSLNVSEYNQGYLGRKIAHPEGVLELYGRLFHLVLKNSPVPLEDFILVDYGGGSGAISYLAVELGVGTVIYNDIYDVSCEDVRCISKALELPLDHIVCGDVEDVVSYLQEHVIPINAIISYDVLEHIYDVESHFRKWRTLSVSSPLIVYASGANIENRLYVNSVKKKQIDCELRPKDKVWGHKERDTLQAYLDVRRDMITAHAPDLSPDDVERLGGLTRGLMRQDLEECVDEFRREGSISYRMEHPTNTCDPYTGNWCEHLMDLDWLEQVVRDAGFSVNVLTGRYNGSGSLPKRAVKVCLNAMIQVLGRGGMFLSPYYVVQAEFIKQDA